MAWRYCGQPGCATLVPRGRCAVHTRQQRAYTDRHHTGVTAYNSARWVSAARAFKAAHPFCVNAGTGTPRCTLVTEDVDHVEPHRGDAARFWDATNWQPMCKACHSVKTAREVNGEARR